MRFRPVNPAGPVLLFTDLDGTLLDQATYRPGPAAAAVRSLIDQGVAVVMATSKTAAETHHHAADLGIPHRAIVENGGAIIWDGVEVASFGMAYHEVRERLASAAVEAAVSVRGYGDVSDDELSRRTGLSSAAAERARQRCWSETFTMEPADDASQERLEAALSARRMRLTRGGRFHTTHGDHDKVSGVPLAVELSGSAKRLTFGVGDAGNDLGFLGMVSHPMVVRRPDGTWLDAPGAVPLAGIGPDGFVLAARRLLEIAGRAVEKGGDRATR